MNKFTLMDDDVLIKSYKKLYDIIQLLDILEEDCEQEKYDLLNEQTIELLNRGYLVDSYMVTKKED